MPSPTPPTLAVRICAATCLFCSLVFVTRGADPETTLPPDVSAPPPPYTKAVDPDGWILDVLQQLYPWREWSKLQIGANKLAISASYTLNEPEYVEIKDKKTPDGQDLAHLYYLPVVFARQCRPAGDHGQFNAAGVTWVANYDRDMSRGHFTVSGVQDTPDDTKATAGVAFSKISDDKRVIDVGGPLFAENYPKWIQQHGQYVALFKSPKATQWAGAVVFPQSQVKLRIQIDGGIELFNEQGKPLLERVRVHLNDFYDFDASGGDYGLVRIVNPVVQTSDSGVAALQEYLQKHANPLEKSEDRVATLMLVNLRIKIIDADTIRVSALGIPETIFHKLP